MIQSWLKISKVFIWSERLIMLPGAVKGLVTSVVFLKVNLNCILTVISSWQQKSYNKITYLSLIWLNVNVTLVHRGPAAETGGTTEAYLHLIFLHYSTHTVKRAMINLSCLTAWQSHSSLQSGCSTRRDTLQTLSAQSVSVLLDVQLHALASSFSC